MLNAKDTERVLENAFSLEFLQATLTQKLSEAPVMYKGPANITQQGDGSLILKLYHLYESTDELVKDANDRLCGIKFRPGLIIEDEHYFDFEGVDLSGYIWTSPRIWVSGDVSFPCNGKLVMATLQRIETRWKSEVKQQPETINAQVYIPGKFCIPYTKTEQRENSIYLSVCELSIAGRQCVLQQHDSHLEIIADLTGKANPDDHLDLILEGLSIGIGCRLHPLLKKVNALGQQIQVIHSHAKNERQLKLPSPIPISQPHNATNLQAFLDRFIETISDHHSPLVGYWFRVLQAFSNGVENRALVLTTAIEGLVKQCYHALEAPDKEFIKQLAEAEPLIEDLPVEIERAKKYLKNALSNAKRNSPKNSLYALAQTKLISESMVIRWSKLRNKSTHADELKLKAHELQAFLDELNVCLELFYRLILGIIGYSAQIVQYSIIGWPETKLNVVLTHHKRQE
ncbi:MAG: hypothetical protein H0X43_09305 [Nitrosospira sp.]|nr:hypothetical protein [Nitrosospira sp.]